MITWLQPTSFNISPGNLAGEGASRFPVQVLRGQADGRPFEDAVHGLECRDGGATSTSRSRALAQVSLMPATSAVASARVLCIFQLPAISARRGAAFLIARAPASPGRTRPSRNSSEAPPPVETWPMRSLRPERASAAIESPPPTTVSAELSAIAAAMAMVRD